VPTAVMVIEPGKTVPMMGRDSINETKKAKAIPK
jgi:hypothetical protein